MRVPEIELLWWDGCPSAERALSDLRAALEEVGLDAAAIRMREIRTDADAQDAAFRGSPTILIDGTDAGTDEGADELIGLSCRVYRRRDGRISPVPDPDHLRERLRTATLTEVAG